MNPSAETYEATLERVCRTIVAETAAAVDRDASFPAQSIHALASAGLLGAISSIESQGLGLGLAGAARIVRRVAEECGSTAMVLTMHYCGAAIIEAHGPSDVRREVASGAHLSTLAFSEAGSRSHFWAPLSTAERRNGHVVLNASKSWITSASRATAYVWSSRPLAAEGASAEAICMRDTDRDLTSVVILVTAAAFGRSPISKADVWGSGPRTLLRLR